MVIDLEVLNVKVGVKEAIILLLPRTHIKVLREGPCHQGASSMVCGSGVRPYHHCERLSDHFESSKPQWIKFCTRPLIEKVHVNAV
jgi:hypothetical protein